MVSTPQQYEREFVKTMALRNKAVLSQPMVIPRGIVQTSDGRFLQRRLTRRQAQEMVETNTYTPPLFTREARRQSGMGRTRRGTL